MMIGNRRSRLMGLCALFAAAILLSSATSTEAGKPRRLITRPKFDPEAKRVELFEGMENGELAVEVLPKDANGGNVLFENKTDQPITVELPEAVVTVQVLKQGCGFGCLGGGCGGGGGCGSGGGQAQSGGGGIGGGLGGGGLGGGLGGLGGGGGGFFSIPPERTVRLPYKTVCLEHGKPDPKPRMTYRLVKVDEYTENPALKELLKLVATGRINQQAAQAAAWHLANDMSWRELAAKKTGRLGSAASTPYFTRAQIHAAMQIVALSEGRAKENAKEKDDKDEPVRPRTRIRQ